MLKNYRSALLSFVPAAVALFIAASPGSAHECNGFDGVANFDQGLVLTATTNAPAGARGRAEFIAVNDRGTNYQMLFVKTTGLTNSVYAVRLTDDTGTNTYDLGTLNVVTRTNLLGFCGTRSGHDGAGGDDQGENEQGDSGDRDQQGSGEDGRGDFHWSWSTNVTFQDWGDRDREDSRRRSGWMGLLSLATCTNLHNFATNACWWYTNTLTVGSGSFVLPAGLNQTNAGVLKVSDSNDVVVLTGDFSTTTNSTIIYKEIVDIVPGTATNAHGTATITYQLARSKCAGTFNLDAAGLTASQKLFLTANGTNTVKAFTSQTGTLRVRSFPRLNVATLKDVVARDCATNFVFTVNF